MTHSNQARARAIVARLNDDFDKENNVTILALVKYIEEILDEAASPAPVWSNEKPTVPGWYWWRPPIRTRELRQAVVQIEADGYCLQEGEYVANIGGQWSSLPLEPPQEGGEG